MIMNHEQKSTMNCFSAKNNFLPCSVFHSILPFAEMWDIFLLNFVWEWTFKHGNMNTYTDTQRSTHTQRGKTRVQVWIVIVMKPGLVLSGLERGWVAPSLVTSGCRSLLGKQSHLCDITLLVKWMAKSQMSDNSTWLSLPSVWERRRRMCNLVKWKADTEPSDVPAQPLFHRKQEAELVLTSLRLLILCCQTDWWSQPRQQVLPAEIERQFLIFRYNYILYTFLFFLLWGATDINPKPRVIFQGWIKS